MGITLEALRDVTKLEPGDVIQHKMRGEGYVVIQSGQQGTIAVRSITVMNPDEWLVMRKTWE